MSEYVLVLFLSFHGVSTGTMFQIPVVNAVVCEREAPKLKTKLFGAGNEKDVKHYCLNNTK